jgi:hypothetical protein
VNTAKLPDIFRERNRISDEDYALLKELRRRYPYFQAVHILVAKAARDRGDLDAPAFLKSASLHAGDRKALYEYLISPALRKHIRDFEQGLDPGAFVGEPALDIEKQLNSREENISGDQEKRDENQTTTHEQQYGEQINSGITAEKPLEESPSAPTEDLNLADGIGDNPQIPASEPKDDSLAIDSSDSLAEIEKEILYEAIYSSIEKEVQEDMAAAQSSADSSAEDIPEAATLKAHTPFTAWLLERAAKTKFNEASTEDQSAENLEDVRAKAKKLIDTFIQKDPRITPSRAEVYSTENLGRMSLTENEEFVTETLVKIYIQQGKFDKAIRAYKLLMLKFPEKSIYFANQLKKLEENRK